jgi:hypothetical protein
MTQANPQKMSIEQLVDRFVGIALDQDEAIRKEKNTKFNRLFREMRIIEDELKDRPGDQRSSLVRFLKHPNAQVRLRAAIATLALKPDAARMTLQNISDLNEYPQAPDARGMLRALDDGSYTPS